MLPGSEPPSSPQVVEDGGEEDEEELSGGEEGGDFRSSSGRGSLLTRRGITLRVLLKDGLVEPGNGVLTIHYLVTQLRFGGGFPLRETLFFKNSSASSG